MRAAGYPTSGKGLTSALGEPENRCQVTTLPKPADCAGTARARVWLAGALMLVLAGHAVAKPLPDPTGPGPYAVGYTRLVLTRTGTLTPAERRLETVVWYPADVRGEPLDPLGYADAAIRGGRHPLLVYSHGGCAYPEVSSFLTRALASWGFVVAAPSHPGDTFSDGVDVCDLVELRGPTLVERVDDVQAVVDALLRDARTRGARFHRRLARSRIGVLGWSSGGSTALVAGRQDRRIRAVLSLAPDARPERIGTAALPVPAMVMVGTLDYYDPAQTSLDQVYGYLRPPRFAVQLRRTGHFAFSDPCIPLAGGRDCEPGSLTQPEAHRLVLRFAVPFMQRYVGRVTRWGSLLRPAAVTEADASLRAELPTRSPAPGSGYPGY